MSMQPLPQELIDVIIDEVAVQDPDFPEFPRWSGTRWFLAQCSLISRTFRSACQRYLFNKIEVSLTHWKKIKRLQTFTHLIERNPRIPTYIRNLSIYFDTEDDSWATDPAGPMLQQLLQDIRSGGGLQVVQLKGHSTYPERRPTPEPFLDSFWYPFIAPMVLERIRLDDVAFNWKLSTADAFRDAIQWFRYSRSSQAATRLNDCIISSPRMPPQMPAFSFLRYIWIDVEYVGSLTGAQRVLDAASASLEEFHLKSRPHLHVVTGSYLGEFNLSLATRLQILDVDVSFSGDFVRRRPSDAHPDEPSEDEPLDGFSSILHSISPANDLLREVRLNLYLSYDGWYEPSDIVDNPNWKLVDRAISRWLSHSKGANTRLDFHLFLSRYWNPEDDEPHSVHSSDSSEPNKESWGSLEDYEEFCGEALAKIVWYKFPLTEGHDRVTFHREHTLDMLPDDCARLL
ncbi:hypothetical protein NLJ89_g3422 [Agrocybe chaxingu]|uniref:Uncharacterized protein n=1 Tax=Agrocybe chaxingu TaxID=84603 RepID=A0A9W8K4N5_9AGAR|nr:hypothetical protein NLJ89_g3422 [Agrocybe chaxingu]